MFHFDIIVTPESFIIKKDILERILGEIQAIETSNHFGTLNIIFLEDREIQKLNKQYRNIDAPTDVLSFHYFDDFSALEQEETVGEIIFSENKVIEQGKQYKLGSELEFYKLFIHGVLHILGYDHESNEDFTIMQNKEDAVWKNVFI